MAIHAGNQLQNWDILLQHKLRIILSFIKITYRAIKKIILEYNLEKISYHSYIMLIDNYVKRPIKTLHTYNIYAGDGDSRTERFKYAYFAYESTDMLPLFSP